MNASIRFSHGFLTKIRSELLANTDQEAFAVALGSRQEILGKTNVVIREIFTLDESDYISRSLGHVTPRKEIIMEILSNVTRRLDVDTIIDIHTHPFSNEHVNFSSVDDRDERQFAKFMNQYFDGIHFASIVFSRNRYRARFWEYDENNLTSRRASIKTQTSFENIPESTDYDRVSVNCDFNDSMQARTILALGLDNCRRMTSGQKIVLAGVGGLGSVMAEHLVHLGFSRIGLIDPDCLEISNMNRFVGATLEDAKIGLPKVEVVERHIKSINPNISVDITQECLDHIAARKMMADADWILLSTDNHSSRLSCQTTALEFGIPLISAGVNISVAENKVSDMSGEVITIRLCLSGKAA